MQKYKRRFKVTNRIDRLFGIILLIQGWGKATVKELSEYFEVSERTILRDIAALGIIRELPLISLPGPDGGYRIAENFYLKNIHLSKEETLSIYLCQNLLESPSIYKTALRTAFIKIGSTLPSMIKKNMLSCKKTIMISDSQIKNSILSNKIFYAVNNAILKKYNILIHYRDKSGKKTNRKVSPYGLMFNSKNWFLVGRCYLRNEVRIFRLKGIKRLSETIEPFQIPGNFDIQKGYKNFLKELISINPDNFEVQFICRKSKLNYLRKHYLGQLFDIKIADEDNVEVTYSDTDVNSCAHFLFSLGPNTKVIKPEEVKNRLVVLADRMKELNTKNS